VKKKGFEAKRATTMGSYDIGTSTPLASNKRLHPYEVWSVAYASLAPRLALLWTRQGKGVREYWNRKSG